MTPTAALATTLPPWVIPPAGFDSFDFGASIDTPAIGTGDTVVLSFRVPSQYCGVIRGLTHYTTGPGFGQGSGDLVWRIRRDNQFVRNYGNLTVSFGSAQESRDIYGIMLNPNQVVYYLVSNVSYGPIGTKIVCQMKGWYWPL